MEKTPIQKLLSSRVFWTLAAGFAVNIYNLFSPSLPPALTGVLDMVVLFLANYFHVNPSQTYNLPTDGSAVEVPVGARVPTK